MSAYRLATDSMMGSNSSTEALSRHTRFSISLNNLRIRGCNPCLTSVSCVEPNKCKNLRSVLDCHLHSIGFELL